MNQQWLGGRYKIVRIIGRGGQSEVYLAVDRRLGRKVAIKRSNLLRLDEKDRKRFLREARMLANIRHHHIIPIYSLEEENDRFYVVMQYADPGSLQDRIVASPKGLPIVDVVDIGVALCKALAAVHARGIIHRDVKPGNVLLVSEEGEDKPVPKLTDFGMARDPTATPLTTKGEILGTLQYVPPEAIAGTEGKVDARRDVYGLGAVLFEAVTGRPLLGSEVGEVIKHLGRAPKSPRIYRSDVPPWLELVILKALAPDRRNRYHDTRAMLADLVEGKRLLEMEGAGGSLSEEEPGEAPPAPPGEETPASESLLVRWGKLTTSHIRDIRDQVLATLVASALLQIMGVIVLLILSFFGLKSCVGAMLPTPIPPPSPTAVATSPSVVLPTDVVTIAPVPAPSQTPEPPATPSPPTSTPSPTLTSTATPTFTPSPTSTPTPTPTITPTSTPSPVPPTPAPPEPLAPAFGLTYKNPIVFEWQGSLGAGQTYQVTAYRPNSDDIVLSNPLADESWSVHLPAEKYGEWRWRVAVVQQGSTVAKSPEWMFHFDPFAPSGGGGGTPSISTPAQPKSTPAEPGSLSVIPTATGMSFYIYSVE